MYPYWRSKPLPDLIQSFIDFEYSVSITEDIIEDIETTNTYLSGRFHRQMMWQVIAKKVFGGEVNAGTGRFGFDLCDYGPIVWMAAIINRSFIERLGDPVRLGISEL